MKNIKDYLALAREASYVGYTLTRAGWLELPKRLGSSLLQDPGFDSLANETRFYEILGEGILDTIDRLGPVYGKAFQVLLSRAGDRFLPITESLQLGRVYGDWPPIPFESVERILDQDVPLWRDIFEVSPYPLGVASMAQVHQAKDRHGRVWVMKVIKPQAKDRLICTLEAINQLVTIIRPFAISSGTRRMLREIRELCAAVGGELQLEIERQNLDTARQQHMDSSTLVIPKTFPEFCSQNVLTMEKLEGIPFSSLVRGKNQLDPKVSKKLSKRILTELLIQIFEQGLFHGDPHAGNLVLMPDGKVGLYDWGLAGSLLESDRRHIAGMLKAVMALDMDQLSQVLLEMSGEDSASPTKEQIKTELGKVVTYIKKERASGGSPGFQKVLERCLKVAERLNIVVPSGLLMMAKSLLTIEGLARGIDPDLSFLKVASPVLLRAARPGWRDLWKLTAGLARLRKIPDRVS